MCSDVGHAALLACLMHNSLPIAWVATRKFSCVEVFPHCTWGDLMPVSVRSWCSVLARRTTRSTSSLAHLSIHSQSGLVEEGGTWIVRDQYTNPNATSSIARIEPGKGMKSRDFCLGDHRGKPGTELLSGFQTILHPCVKVLEEPLDSLLLPPGLIPRRRAAFLLVLSCPFVTPYRVSAAKIVSALIAEVEFGRVVFGRITVTPEALPGAQFYGGA